jgi:3-dehydroquinate synthase
MGILRGRAAARFSAGIDRNGGALFRGAMETITVELADRRYPIHIGSEAGAALHAAVAEARGAGRKVALITDENLRRAQPGLFARLDGVPELVLPAGEETKSIERLGEALEFLAGERIDRGGVVLAVGGGVIGDLAGYAAAAYLRGIDVWQVPTTLLAMVDSSVGGKTGINLRAGKNLAGAFHQPRAVYICTDLLGTLPAREFAAGMAEILKYGLLGDAELWEQLRAKPYLAAADERLPAVIRRCCAIKAEVVRNDERETAASGGRALLNLGHTFGHAIEKVAGYGSYLHGEAVAIGLIAAARLSERTGRVPLGTASEVASTVRGYGLPDRLREPLAGGDLMAAMRSDKKVRGGTIRFVVLETIGRAATADDVPAELAAEVWSELGAG